MSTEDRCRLRPALRDELRWIDRDGIWHDLDFSIDFRTADGAQQVWVRIRGARLRSGVGALEDADTCVEFEEAELLRRILSRRESSDLLSWMSDQNVRVTGPCLCLAKFVQILGASHLGSRPHRRPGRWPSDPPEDGELEILARCGSPKPFGSPTGARFLPKILPMFSPMSVGTSPSQRIVHASSLPTRHMLGEARFEAMVPGAQLDQADHVDRIVSQVRASLQHGGMLAQVATLNASQLQRAEEEVDAYRNTIIPVCG